jgi:hypothetical protein
MKELVAKNNISIEIYDPSKIYDDTDIINLGHRDYWNHVDDQFPNNRILIEGQGESNSGKWGTVFNKPNNSRFLFVYGGCKNSDASNILFYENFFWHQLALDYISRGYHNYRPEKTYKNTFLMPVRNHKGQAAWRGDVINMLRDQLSNALYSIYVEGKFLPGSTAKSDIREIHYSWFDDTHFSLTLESYYDHAKPIFKTEKVFKPLAFFHPFQVIASPGFLKNLRTSGFETFNNLFDESYDDINDIVEKISIIKKNVVDYEYAPYDELTMSKLEHNHNHFYNTDVIYSGIQTQFINPIKEWADR